VRKHEALYLAGADAVTLDCRKVATLRFSGHGAPLSATIYNKVLEIRQKSGKTWFYDLWARNGWDGESPVWRVEFRFKREFLGNLEHPIDDPYDLLDRFRSLWSYAAGQASHSSEEEHELDGWLRYVIPSAADTNRSRWAVHPVWVLVQQAFIEPESEGLGPVVRERKRQRNLEQGLAATVGYLTTLTAWLGGQYAAPDADLSLMLRWLYEAGLEYLEDKQLDFQAEVRKKQARFGLMIA
jgi:hypothetical protein